MRSSLVTKSALLLVCLFAAPHAPAPVASAHAARVLPNPVLVFITPEDYEAGGKQWTRYRFAVDNSAAYPADMFAAAPSLPPCGTNTNSSRTWVDIYEQSGKRLYGFCALKSPDGLNQIWFALERDVMPPSWVYIELNDRQTNTKYKSNLADTVQ
jgi:hypothetical protein